MLEKVDEELARAHSRPLSMISCNLIFFKEAKCREEDTHPLRYRFEEDRTILPADDLQDHMQLSAATAWFRRDLIERHGLRFDPRIFPTFEDSHFVNRFLLLNPNSEVAFLKGPIYYYRKRADGTSSLDGAKLTPAWCLDALRYGFLDLLNQAQRIAGAVPYFIQRTVLYDILFRFEYLVDHPERVPLTSSAERKEFFELLIQIFMAIDRTTINTFELRHCTEMHKVGLLGLMKHACPPVTKVYLRQHDEPKGLMQFSYFSAEPQIGAIACINERTVPLQYISRRRSTFLDRDYCFEHFFWVPLGPGDYLRVFLEDKTCDLMCDIRHLGAMVTLRELQGALKSRSIAADRAPPKAIAYLRHMAATPEARTRYDACWLFVDRPSKADDNAEHLYRYLFRQGLTEKMFFVVKRDSPDWAET